MEMEIKMEVKGFNRNSIIVRLLMIGILILVLMIPTVMINGLIGERSIRKAEAVAEITSKWAQAQTVGGPVITIPYERSFKDDQGKVRTEMDYAQFLPEELGIEGKIRPEIRYRGIYKAAVYNLKLKLAGRFSFAKLERLNLNPERIHWNEAFMAVQITDMRGIKDSVGLIWGGRQFRFEPGIFEGGIFTSGISLRIPLNTISAQEGSAFSINLNLNGSEELSLQPLGQTTTVQLSSTWNSPSFTGAFLPETRRVDKNGFNARWKVLDLNRNYPQQWVGDAYNDNLKGSEFGVKLFSPVDEYTQVNRAVKYIFMFVGLTFLVFFLVEVFNKRKIHPVQYLLIGLSLCIFYVLLLSLSEHINFQLAYLIAGISIIGLIGAYVRSALGGKWVTFLTAGLLVALYGYLYILLQNQDYALLMGSIGVFIIMAIVMYISRNIDWYKIEMKD